jgi:integrase
VLRERRAVGPRAGIAELGSVLRGIGHVDLEPVDRQQPPPPQPRPARGALRVEPRRRRDFSRDRAARALELPHVVQAIARHANLEITMKIYAHTNLDTMREALDKIDWDAE